MMNFCNCHSPFIINMRNFFVLSVCLKILIFDVVVLIAIFLIVPARSNCRERVHGVCCWSKPFWTDDFLPIGWMVGKSYGFHPPAPVVLFDCLHFVQCLLFNARDISNLSKILDGWSPVLCWSKFRFVLVFTVFYTDTNFTYWDNATQLKCCVILAYGACDVKKFSGLYVEVPCFTNMLCHLYGNKRLLSPDIWVHLIFKFQNYFMPDMCSSPQFD